jgi:hypothetical protein
MASRPFQTFTSGFGRSALDLPVAALAALAVAFAAFAMPGDLMARLVEASGLPGLLSAAAPPLGLKARLGVSLGGALAAFGIVFVLLRLLDRTGFEARRPRPEPRLEPRYQPEEVEEPEEAPRLRRRDFHPDAPARRPISAIRDLGEPAPPQPPIASPWPEAPAPPGWEPESVAEPALEPSPLLLTDPEPEPEPDPAPEYRDDYLPDYRSEPRDEALPTPEAVPDPAPAADTQSASLDALMARLEQGLARRARPAPAPEPAPASEEVRHEVDDRLQNAIESLQRFAARD